MRIFVTGKPASGKTTLVKKLCEDYKLHHIHAKAVIGEAMENLVGVTFDLNISISPYLE